MQVGLFTESYDPVINGVSASVKTLALQLREQGHIARIVAPRYPRFTDSSGADALSVLRLPSWRTPFNPQNPFAFPPLGPIPTALQGVDFDIVHTQQPFGMGMHGRRIARRHGVPLITTFHTLYTEYVHYFPVVPHRIAVWWVARQLRRYYCTCDAIIVPSREAGRRLTAIGVDAAQQIVVPTGIETPMPVPRIAIDEARCRFHLPAGAPVVLFVGRIAREKNMDVLLNAFSRLGGVSPAPYLLIVGSGPYRADCEAFASQLGIADRVRFAGFIPRQELGPIYALADVFAFPSSTETQGMVVAEAQSHGLPCVVVDRGGAAELVRGGVDALVTPLDTEAFTRALAKLLQDPVMRSAFGREALENPLRPTPSDMARKIIAVYRDARARHHLPLL